MDLLTIFTYSAVTLTSAAFLTAEFLIESRKYRRRKHARLADLAAKLEYDGQDKYFFEQFSDAELRKLDRQMTEALRQKRQAELDKENRRVLENLL